MSDAPEEFALREFDPMTIPNDAICLFIGIRNAGKSTLVEDILYQKRFDIPAMVVISGSEGANKFYGHFVPDSFIFEELDTKVIANLWHRQKILKNSPPSVAGKSAAEFRSNVLVIFDDLMAESKQAFNHPDVRAIFLNGRHYGFSAFVLIQYVRDLSPALRLNTDFIFLLREENLEVRQMLYKLVGGFETFAKFNQVFGQFTDKFGCLVFNRRSKSNKISDKLFWYRAKTDHGKWRIESPDMWAFHQNHYMGTNENQTYDWNQGVFPVDSVSEANNKTASSKRKSATSIKHQPYVLHRFDKQGNPLPDD